MAKESIIVRDFELVYEIVKSLSRMADGVKFAFDADGLVVNAKNAYSKCNLTSNAARSERPVEFCIADLQTFLKVLTTVKDMYKGDYGQVGFFYDAPFFRVESGKFKTKIAACEEARVSKFVATKIKTELTPKLVFTTNSSMIKAINGHSFVFPNSDSARVYLTTEPDMQNNTIFATIGDESNDLANSVTLELGLVNSGSLSNPDGTQMKIILDFNRLNIFNMVPSDEIKVMVANERPVLVSTTTKDGKDGAFFKVEVCSFMLVR